MVRSKGEKISQGVINPLLVIDMGRGMLESALSVKEYVISANNLTTYYIVHNLGELALVGQIIRRRQIQVYVSTQT